MRTIKGFAITAWIVGILVASTAFMTITHKKETKKKDLKGDDKGFAVVELFTSEGCSSCPPADELVAGIQKENPNKEIYILAYHVDYWDHQGWKDTYSNPDYSKRQTQYATWLNLQTIYTPQIVMNGKSEFVGSDQGALQKAIAAGLRATPASHLTIKGIVEKGQISIDYQTDASLKRSDLVVALVQKSGQSSVLAGENTGRTLTHVQIVRKLATGSLHTNSGMVSLALPEDYKGKEWELIGFVQNRMDGAILSAAKSTLVINE